MKKLLLLFCVFNAFLTGIAQQEKFDIATYLSPAGYTTSLKEGRFPTTFPMKRTTLFVLSAFTKARKAIQQA